MKRHKKRRDDMQELKREREATRKRNAALAEQEYEKELERTNPDIVNHLGSQYHGIFRGTQQTSGVTQHSARGTRRKSTYRVSFHSARPLPDLRAGSLVHLSNSLIIGGMEGKVVSCNHHDDSRKFTLRYDVYSPWVIPTDGYDAMPLDKLLEAREKLERRIQRIQNPAYSPTSPPTA